MTKNGPVMYYYGHPTGIGTAVNIKRDRYFRRSVFLCYWENCFSY